MNIFYWGFKLITEKKINNFISKIFYTLIYIIFGTIFVSIFHNDSFWLIDNGNGGFIGNIVRDKFYSITTLIENQYVVFFILLLSVTFFLVPALIFFNQSQFSKILIVIFSLFSIGANLYFVKHLFNKY